MLNKSLDMLLCHVIFSMLSNHKANFADLEILFTSTYPIQADVCISRLFGTMRVVSNSEAYLCQLSTLFQLGAPGVFTQVEQAEARCGY